MELAALRGIDVRTVDAFAPDFFDQLSGCDAFMWRFGYSPVPRLFAKRLLTAVEQALHIPVFPSTTTAWHFEDKIGQHYLLQAAGVPSPETRVFWSRDSALEFCRSASYPLVMKLSSGFQSANVRLLRSRRQAEHWIAKMFGPGVTSLNPQSSPGRIALQRARAALRRVTGSSTRGELNRSELQHGYFYVQEFLGENAFDTRVTVIGDRAFAFRRFNRPGDFRASGSGRIDWDPEQIDLDSIRLAYRVARQLKTQSIAVDVLRRRSEHVICEISYTYASWAVRDCPGHWILQDDAGTGHLAWVDGKMAPEDAIFDDFVECLGPR
jgi:glutathione synthase/RimK-type ligase-like ATP-grasp enzyme